ncbi:hypothetical protein J3E69DRAFT_328747 [Trichoderma sp. SZMC 28015]
MVISSISVLSLTICAALGSMHKRNPEHHSVNNIAQSLSAGISYRLLTCVSSVERIVLVSRLDDQNEMSMAQLEEVSDQQLNQI